MLLLNQVNSNDFYRNWKKNNLLGFRKKKITNIHICPFLFGSSSKSHCWSTNPVRCLMIAYSTSPMLLETFHALLREIHFKSESYIFPRVTQVMSWAFSTDRPHLAWTLCSAMLHSHLTSHTHPNPTIMMPATCLARISWTKYLKPTLQQTGPETYITKGKELQKD